MPIFTTAFRTGALFLVGMTASWAAPAIKIGALLKDRSPGFWQYAEQGIIDAAQKLGAEVIIKAPPTVMDVGAQFRLLAALEAEKIDVLIIAATNPDQFEAPIAALVAKGIKVVALDTPLKDGLAHAFVGADQSAVGETAARLFASIIGDHDEVALLRNNSLDRTVIERERKFFAIMKVLRPSAVLHSEVYASSEKDSEVEQVRLLLGKHPGTKAIFASATRGTLATVKVARENGLAGKIKIVGFGTYLPADAVRGFEDGLLVGWVAQQPKDGGCKAAELAVALVKGESVPAVVRPNFTVVTQENFSTPAVQALLNP